MNPEVNERYSHATIPLRWAYARTTDKKICFFINSLYKILLRTMGGIAWVTGRESGKMGGINFEECTKCFCVNGGYQAPSTKQPIGVEI